ncbi:MAG: hypothetical protein ABIQ27_01465 [Flavobacterium sp.]|uniref:hypothetical protein n=1 Tax=Flavobacterium sp. TaxID=239 RepID=UPI003262E185
MKKIIAITLLLLNAHFAIAQNTIAKLKYEEAEEAYSATNYELTISKLKEVETLLKTTNPKILYLRISAQSKIIAENPYEDFDLVSNTRILSTKYLKAYESLPNNEDKYRDIYKISEKLKSLPATTQDFDLKKKQIEIDSAERKKEEVNNKLKYEEAFRNYVYIEGLKIGLTLQETIKEYPRYKKYIKNATQQVTRGSFDYAIFSKEGYGSNDVAGFFIKNNKAIGYMIIINDFSNAMRKINKDLNFEPVVTIKEEGLSPYFQSAKTATYIWKKNNKSIELTQMTVVMLSGSISVTESISSVDQDLAK